MSKLDLTDTVQTALFKMSEGNPGGLTVMMQMMQHGDAIDPDGFMGGFGAIMWLDTYEIYGSRIWILYKDVCGCNLLNTFAMIRACQLGFISSTKLNNAIDGKEQVDVADFLQQVKNRLPAFGHWTEEANVS